MWDNATIEIQFLNEKNWSKQIACVIFSALHFWIIISDYLRSTSNKIFHVFTFTLPAWIAS